MIPQLYKTLQNTSNLYQSATIHFNICLLFVLLITCVRPALHQRPKMLPNPWLYPSPPTLTPYPMTPYSIWISTPTIAMPSSPPLLKRAILHLPVFSITCQLKMLQNQTTLKGPPQRWKFKTHISLSFQCCLLLPTVPPLSKWRLRST